MGLWLLSLEKVTSFVRWLLFWWWLLSLGWFAKWAWWLVFGNWLLSLGRFIWWLMACVVVGASLPGVVCQTDLVACVRGVASLHWEV
ncbi:unnamed protein product, partial [Vitis vinifera]